MGDGREILVGQDHVGALTGHVHGVARADADIGRVECGQVVDAVAQEPGGVSVGAQRGDDPGLVLGGAACEDGGAAGGHGELAVRQAVDGVGGEDDAGVQPEVAAGAGRGARVVAREDLDGDAPVGEDLQGLRRGRGERVAQGDEADEGQAALVNRGVGAIACPPFRGGDRENPQAARRLPGGQGEQAGPFALGEGAALEDVFR